MLYKQKIENKKLKNFFIFGKINIKGFLKSENQLESNGS